MGHSVESRRTDPCLSSLLRQRAYFHDAAENAFVALHGQLDIATQVVPRFSLPSNAPLLSNGLNVLASCESPAWPATISQAG